MKVTRNGNGAVLWTSGAGGRGVLVAGTEPPHVMELWDWTLGPQDRHASEAHAPGTRELVHVLDGSMTIDIGGDTATLTVGDALAFPGDLAHAYVNAHRQPARFSLAVFEPVVAPGRRSEVTHG